SIPPATFAVEPPSTSDLRGSNGRVGGGRRARGCPAVEFRTGGRGAGGVVVFVCHRPRLAEPRVDSTDVWPGAGISLGRHACRIEPRDAAALGRALPRAGHPRRVADFP